MNSPGIDPTDEIPNACVRILEESSDTQLREIIDSAQQLLRDKPSLTDAIESREGEELVRIEDHGAYTLVIAERANETGAARGAVRLSSPVGARDRRRGRPVQVALLGESVR